MREGGGALGGPRTSGALAGPPRNPGAPGGPRTQRIQLARAAAGGYGFSIRGGAEHQLGIYVSEVQRGSEAHLQGLQVGLGGTGHLSSCNCPQEEHQPCI